MKKPAVDPRTCASCESCKLVNSGNDAGHCHLMPPVWIEVDGIGKWARPVVASNDTCRMYLRRLNS
jgi:hypothetical protein